MKTTLKSFTLLILSPLIFAVCYCFIEFSSIWIQRRFFAPGALHLFQDKVNSFNITAAIIPTLLILLYPYIKAKILPILSPFRAKLLKISCVIFIFIALFSVSIHTTRYITIDEQKLVQSKSWLQGNNTYFWKDIKQIELSYQVEERMVKGVDYNVIFPLLVLTDHKGTIALEEHQKDQFHFPFFPASDRTHFFATIIKLAKKHSIPIQHKCLPARELHLFKRNRTSAYLNTFYQPCN